MMTVAEMIKALEKMPQNMLVAFPDTDYIINTPEDLRIESFERTAAKEVVENDGWVIIR